MSYIQFTWGRGIKRGGGGVKGAKLRGVCAIIQIQKRGWGKFEGGTEVSNLRNSFIEREEFYRVSRCCGVDLCQGMPELSFGSIFYLYVIQTPVNI